MMQSKVWMVLSLVIVCLVAGFGLSQVYLITLPKIEQQKKDALNTALTTVLPQARTFQELEPGVVWAGLDSLGAKVGIVFRAAEQGYGGPVPVVVGVDTSARITAISIASPAEGMKETPGLGLKALEPWFRNQFAGKTASEVKVKKDDGPLDAISGATITSRAVAKGVRLGLEKYVHYLAP